MKIATAGSITSKRWRTQEISWETVRDRLRTPLRTGESFAEYQRMSKDERGRRKGVAGAFVGGAMQGGRRVAGSVTERWLITLDADEAKEDDWANATALRDDWAMVCYSTHSHSKSAPRLRWVIPLRRSVGREEYQAVARMAALQLGILETLDPTTYQPERGMYWPSCARDGEYVYQVQEGDALDPDEVLGMYGPGKDAWRDTSAWPIASREQEIVLRAAKKQADPESKPGLVGAFCRTFDVPGAIDTFLPEVYADAGEGRYTYTGGSTSAGAVLYEGGAFLYSNHATDPAGGQLCNAYDLVRIHKFGALDAGQENQETSRLPSSKAMQEWASQLPELKRVLAQESMARAEQDFSDLTDLDLHPDLHPDKQDEKDKNDGMNWTEQLTREAKSGAVAATADNLLLILEHDPKLAGRIARNEFNARPVRRGPLPWRGGEVLRDGRNGDPWSDDDDAGLRWYLEKYWGVENRNKVTDAWNMVLGRHAFHPVREYLEGLTWDGVERLDSLLIRWMGAQDSPYVRAVTRKWMTAAVARIMHPGCKFDQMLVLVGPQGVGKSTLAWTLSRGWFSDSLNGMGTKEAFEALRGVWIVELAELAATRRSEEETIKNYLTKRVDTYRPAYARQVVDYPRQCVFYGTTNDPNIIKDRTGGRRYWPVEVRGIDRGQLDGLEAEVDQLWAEATERWKQGETLWMDDETLHRAEQEVQESFTLADDLTGLIEEYLDTPLPENWDDLAVDDRRCYIQGQSLTDPSVCTLRREVVSVLEIRMELFGETRESIGRNDSTTRRICGVLARLHGWERTGRLKRQGPYGPQSVFVRAGQ
jgi:predicted P-loop ATPase